MTNFVRKYPPTRASLTLVRDILVRVLRKAERDWPTTVPLLRKQVAQIEADLQQFDSQVPPEAGAQPMGLGGTRQSPGTDRSDGDDRG